MPGLRVSKVDWEKIGLKHRCNSCELVLRDPVQTECAHHFCRSCVDSLMGSTKEFKCPRDGFIIRYQNVFPDAFVWREVLSIIVLCLYHENGCPWKGEIRHFEVHLNECEYVQVNCVFASCGALVTRKNLSHHLEHDCSERNVKCRYCNKDVVLSHVKVHEETECQAFPEMCTLCHKKDIPRAKLSQHYDPFYDGCDEAEATCMYSPIGCEEPKRMKKKERHQHEASASVIVFHLRLLLGFILRLRDQLQAVLSECALFREEIRCITMIKETISNIVSQIKVLVHRNTEIQEVLKSQDGRMRSLEKNSDSKTRKQGFEQRSGSPANEMDLRRRVNSSEQKAADNELQAIQLVATVEDLKAEATRLRRQIEDMKEISKRYERWINNQETVEAMRNLTLADLQEYVRDQEYVNHEGVLLWKISQFARRRNDAVTGKQTSFYSPCFYSSSHGQKMCARIYLNGDGMGRGTHISLFFVLMRSEYDALLPWPFKQKVTMMLLDQDKEEHVIDAFRPDPCSSSFQKPKTEMNVASGCPTFCALPELTRHAYIRDDCMFIKVIIDKTDM